MADFNIHVEQSKHNLLIFRNLNTKVRNSTDWQITACFYTALHLINAYLSKEAGLHYHTHKDVDDAINPNNPLSPVRLENDIYRNYFKLSNLSRKSRYLCSEDSSKRKNHITDYYQVKERDLKKAIIYLNSILVFFGNKYKVEFGRYELVCREFGVNHELEYFIINKAPDSTQAQ